MEDENPLGFGFDDDGDEDYLTGCRRRRNKKKKKKATIRKSRKIRAIGLVCSRLCAHFPLTTNPGECWMMSVDSVVRRLGASKGAVYEVFHVLEAVLLVSKIGTNLYRWNGTGHLSTALAYLKIIGRDVLLLPQTLQDVKELEIHKIVQSSKQNSSEIFDLDIEEVDFNNNREQNESGRESLKKIHILQVCQEFVMIFLLIPQPKIINLDYAAKIIYGSKLDPKSFKSRTRRLYDIANVLMSLPVQLIRKIQILECRGKRTSYQYVGPDVSNLELSEAEIMALPDYRRKHLYFSSGKSALGIPERPLKFEGTMTTRRRMVPQDNGEPPKWEVMRIPGLDLDRLAVENWKDPLSTDTIIALEKHRLGVPISQPLSLNYSILLDGHEVDPDFILHPDRPDLISIMEQKILTGIKNNNRENGGEEGILS